MFKSSLLALSLAILPLQAAHADRNHHDRGGHKGWERSHREYYPRSHRHVVSFNFGVAPYYPHYYRPTTVVYAPPPVLQQPEVIYINNDNSHVVDSGNGRYCREYQTHIRVNGVLQASYGTACMQPDNSWEIIH